jgi:prevent-host-death family protein
MPDEKDHIAVSDFKARCLSLLEEVATQHHMLIITKYGKPIARVCPIDNTKPALLGSWKGIVEVHGDLAHFDSTNEWKAEWETLDD